MSVPALDPETRISFAEGSFGRLAGTIVKSDSLFLVSYCLNTELEILHRDDPIDAIVLPMWGGLGYVAQMARATGASPLRDVGFAVVATDTTAHRQSANEEGLWTRAAICRRQLEDLSLAMADRVLAYGPRGSALARAGRLPEAPDVTIAPRFVPAPRLDSLARGEPERAARSTVEFVLDEPRQGASGVLAALDAARLLRSRGVHLTRPIVSAGPDLVFAPMHPRLFSEYWRSRGWVRELEAAGYWTWAEHRRDDPAALTIRLYPSTFEPLPEIWAELDRGSLPILSPAAAEGFAPDEPLPDLVVLPGEPTPELLADRIAALSTASPDTLEGLRRDLASIAVRAHRGTARQRRLNDSVDALGPLLAHSVKPQSLSRASTLLLDRRRSLREIAKPLGPAVTDSPAAVRPSTLSVVVPCYEMGSLVEETVRSIWASERIPDELLLVDDGSTGEATRRSLEILEAEAARRGMPIRIIRQDNRGLAAARNAGLVAASGDLISFLDGDDLIEPAFYRLASELMDREPGLGGVAAWAICLFSDQPDGYWNAPQSELPLLFVENTVIVPCMMRRSVLIELGGYDESQRYNYEDWELSVRLLANDLPIVTIPRYLQRYRVRAESLYRTMTPAQNQVMRERFLDRHRVTAARFAMEIAMQLEHQLAQYVYQPPAPAAAPAVAADEQPEQPSVVVEEDQPPEPRLEPRPAVVRAGQPEQQSIVDPDDPPERRSLIEDLRRLVTTVLQSLKAQPRNGSS
jgi:glycosyltransferase involved in cell wall biosynthesis